MTQPDPWLIVVDMQPGFGAPDSPWCTPGFETCMERIAALLPRFAGRTLFTRFVPPSQPEDAWVAYYDQWSFALDPAQRHLWKLDPRLDGPQVTSPRFAKWIEARPHVPAGAPLCICGVATDCCVLGTALEAVDDGRSVHLLQDTCAAGSAPLHEAALTVMADRAPMLRIAKTTDWL
ncbi:cysteine hydrolase family protein [Pseudooceanicola aestuarii]|uniref:cysteine hydrolase family protein n=1 Tax=Pseudooceanicola aestuarii TaxID=2697319 RepID=UPI0013D5D787|nr:isochorismatase family protein [Pseudooceanicola aestuarii]